MPTDDFLGSRQQERMRRLRSWAAVAAGWLTAVGLLSAVAEIFLQVCPPRDLHAYLGEESPAHGIYCPHESFGIGYRDWETFVDDNRERLSPYLPLQDTPGQSPLWALFGNSFIHAPGMLADTARDNLTGVRIFNLGRNEDFCLRLAQIELLLERGLQPQRVFIELMPVDLIVLGKQPLETMAPNSRGALTYRPRMPAGPARWLVSHSRLAFTAWVRAGRQVGNPNFDRKGLYDGLDPRLLADLKTAFRHLINKTRSRGVPVSILLVPANHQVLNGRSFQFQDTLSELFRELGCDLLDPRASFLADSSRSDLYLPDGHLSAKGNQLLLDKLLAHCQHLDGRTAVRRVKASPSLTAGNRNRIR